jgi:hypothetical protein
MDLIPTPMMTPEGEWIDDISLDPAFDCEFLTCVSYQGAKAYCTQKCEFDSNCPEDFTCVSVIASDPGPGSNIGPDDKFCVRQIEEFACEN